jgi:uncharacterized protein
MRLLLVVVVATLGAVLFAFRPSVAGTLTFWLGLAIPYALLSLVALYRMWDEGTLLDKLAPRWGDLSIGAVTAALLLVASWGVRQFVAPPGTANQAWLFRIYLQVGDAEEVQRSIGLTALLLLIPLCEELVWRGLVLDLLTNAVGPRAAWPLTALLYALAHLPTLWLLADPVAGLNPLLLLGAFGSGVVWSFLASRTKRLPPVVFSHLAFTYFSVAQFRWPGM